MENNELYHYGTKRHSGRYKWGSGETPYQHEDWFLARVNELRKDGHSEKEIAFLLGITQKNRATGELEGNSGELRRQLKIANNQAKMMRIIQVKALKEKGLSNVQIGKEMGIPDTTVGNLLKSSATDKLKEQQQAVEILRRAADKKKYVDVGVGVEREINISEDSLKTAITQLKNEGYNLYYVKVKQLGTQYETTVRVLAPPNVTYGEVYKNQGKIKPVQEYLSKDDNTTVLGIRKPESISSDRVQVRFKEDGGEDKDGIIELRKGVEDISLGDSKYAQVRIMVDGTHYIKGVAMYSDDLPKGCDILVNSNKSKEKGLYGALKPLKTVSKDSEEIDWDNPFGSYIKAGGQRTYIGEDGKEHLSVINKVNEEGDWEKWSKTLSAQFLAKQSPELIKTQLTLSLDQKKAELQEIMDLTNPTVKKQLLESFANDCDASAVHLKAAALPRQSSKVILPMNSLKPEEIYAPQYKDGEKVALIRYPHGGIFEIPVLTVNNKNKEGISLLGKDITDAVGIHPKAAAQLSGADFDGDTVTIIPTNSKVNITHTDYLAGLQGWDKEMGRLYERDHDTISAHTKQTQMGVCTNLIADMTIKGATEDDLVRAVKQSMVIIDAEKHKLDWKQSAIDLGIKELQQKYQKTTDPVTGKVHYGGATTLITRSKSETRVDERAAYSTVDHETGKKIYKETGASYVKQKKNANGEWVDELDRNGNPKVITKQTKSTKMAEIDDARKLMSTYGSSEPENIKEAMYASYANQLKAMANATRKEALAVKEPKANPSAAKAYEKEVAQLKADLNVALKNAPRERYAQILANDTVRQKVKANPGLSEDADQMKKIRGSALTGARNRVGAKKEKINITDKEWEAIQAGAVSPSVLKKILNNADADQVKQLATPRNTNDISASKRMQIQAMVKTGHYTLAEIGIEFGLSASTISRIAKEQ